MGQTISAWRAKVLALIRDVKEKDLSELDVDAVGIRPAFGQFSVDRPRGLVVEVPGAGSAYLDLPAGWMPGFSRLEAVEYPARLNPPVHLDPASWRFVRKPTDVAIEQILLDRVAATGQFVRFSFTAPWPFPDGTAATDLLDAPAFEAVAHLAASLCLVSLATQAARNRVGALPADVAEGRDRARNLLEAAKIRRSQYDAFVGLVGGDDDGGTAVAPMSRTLDVDPQYHSLFHGGRR